MTDNNIRTVSNIRSYFNKCQGSLGKDGCLQYVFSRKGIFLLPSEGLDEDEFSLAMIDGGAEDVQYEGGHIVVTSALENFGNVQKALQALSLEPREANLERIPLETIAPSKENFLSNVRLIDKLEDDDDVQKVYHNMDVLEE